MGWRDNRSALQGDGRGMNPPKMPVHIGDYKRDTGHLRAAGHGAYLLLLFHHWSTGSLPDDDDQLATIACMTRGEWKKAKPIISKFFKPGWRHGRVEEDLESAKQSYEARAKAGHKGGKAKAKTKQCSSNATAGPEQPLTFNQSKKDAADAAPDPEVDLFNRGKAVLGKNSGGLIAQLLTAKQKNIPLARAAIEQASTKSDPREYIGRIIHGQKPGETAWLGGVEGIV
jgi:uncharacterized protein YdaU (DUF1376 family)